MIDSDLRKWNDKGILCSVRHTLRNGCIKFFADVSRIGFNNRSVTDKDLKDTWIEAYKDLEQKVKKI